MSWQEDLSNVSLQFLLLLKTAAASDLGEAAVRFGLTREAAETASTLTLEQMIGIASRPYAVVRLMADIPRGGHEELTRMISLANGTGSLPSAEPAATDIQALNLAYLVLLRQHIDVDPKEAAIRFGVDATVVDAVAKASPAELRCHANRDFVMVKMRPAFCGQGYCATGSTERVCQAVKAACERGK